jgi:hypothetical protein
VRCGEFDERSPVVSGDRQEARGELKHVKAEILALAKVLGENVLVSSRGG